MDPKNNFNGPTAYLVLPGHICSSKVSRHNVPWKCFEYREYVGAFSKVCWAKNQSESSLLVKASNFRQFSSWTWSPGGSLELYKKGSANEKLDLVRHHQETRRVDITRIINSKFKTQNADVYQLQQTNRRKQQTADKLWDCDAWPLLTVQGFSTYKEHTQQHQSRYCNPDTRTHMQDTARSVYTAYM